MSDSISPKTIKFYLNTALCQFNKHVSKTKKAMEYIKFYSIVGRFNQGKEQNGVHHITAILTNNNLGETAQWKIRLNKDMQFMKAYILSSKKDKDNKYQYNTIDTLIKSMVHAKNVNYLPDLLVMCTHSKRTDDILEFIKALSGNLNFSRIGINKITLTLMFDEADKNIELICECLDNINRLIESEPNFPDILLDVHFITATPLKEFWNKLKFIGIDKLNNLNTSLKSMNSESILHRSYDELMREYRKIDDHTIRNDIDNETKNPVDYAMIVTRKIIEETNKKPDKIALVIFAPSKNTISSHISMKNYYISLGFTVYIDDSKNENFDSKGKGFYTPDNTFESLDDFNKKHNITGEMRDTFVKWKELNPSTNLTITGYLNIERGITFCTIGFNFTDMIISVYHLNNLASLIQFLGRANGGTEYVEVINIWSPKKVIHIANEQIALTNESLKKDPEEFKETDFRKKSKKEIMEPAMTVPKIIKVSDEEFNSLKKKGRSWDESSFISVIKKYDEELVKEINKMKKLQITLPETDDSYKKHIEDPMNAINENKKFAIDIKKGKESDNLYQIYIDSKNKSLIVSLYYGKNIVSTENENTPINEVIRNDSESDSEID